MIFFYQAAPPLGSCCPRSNECTLFMLTHSTLKHHYPSHGDKPERADDAHSSKFMSQKIQAMAHLPNILRRYAEVSHPGRQAQQRHLRTQCTCARVGGVCICRAAQLGIWIALCGHLAYVMHSLQPEQWAMHKGDVMGGVTVGGRPRAAPARCQVPCQGAGATGCRPRLQAARPWGPAQPWPHGAGCMRPFWRVRPLQPSAGTHCNSCHGMNAYLHLNRRLSELVPGQ